MVGGGQAGLAQPASAGNNALGTMQTGGFSGSSAFGNTFGMASSATMLGSGPNGGGVTGTAACFCNSCAGTLGSSGQFWGSAW
jgi:hypothetical protein